MKMTKYCTIALTAIMSISLAHGTALAKTADDDLSVYNWGPWGKMVTPAAGPALVFAAQLPSGYEYLPPVDPVDPVDPVEPQYRSYATYFRSNIDDTYEASQLDCNPCTGRVAATMDPLILEFGEEDDGFGDVTFAQFSVEALVPDPAYPAIDSLAMSGGYSVLSNDGKSFDTFGHEDFVGDDEGKYFRESEILPGQTAPPWMGDIVWGYWFDKDSSSYSANGEFLVGMASPVALMDTLNAGNVQATYIGVTLCRGDRVTFNFDFGAATGNGTFGGTFTTQGNIVGPDFFSTGVTALGPGASATGTVTGSFFGNEAQMFGGLADVIISDDKGLEGYTEVFVTNDITTLPN